MIFSYTLNLIEQLEQIIFIKLKNFIALKFLPKLERFWKFRKEMQQHKVE